MLSISAAQMDAFLVAWCYPLARILAMVGTSPLFGNSNIPRRVRIAIGLVLGFAIVPVLPQAPAIQPGTWNGVATFIMQILIGVSMGLTMRLVFTAVDMAGDIIGLQMGLSFAVFFDPSSSGRTAVLSQILTLLASLVFLSLNGHLFLIRVLATSFELVPIGSGSISGSAWLVLMRIGTIVFGSGLLMSLPLVAALLVTNIALAVLTRSAPQLNIFAIGFPITSTIGMLVLIVTLNAFSPLLQNLFDQGFNLIGVFLKTLPVH
jgi:flagellar biosynthetic protein FliR